MHKLTYVFKCDTGIFEHQAFILVSPGTSVFHCPITMLLLQPLKEYIAAIIAMPLYHIL